MDFNLTEEHLMIRDAARDFAQTELLPGVIERDNTQTFPDELVKKMGAREIHVGASHGVFCGPAFERLAAAPIDSIVVTDSIPVDPAKRPDNLKILSIATMMGEAIKRIHQNKSISAIFSDVVNIG